MQKVAQIVAREEIRAIIALNAGAPAHHAPSITDWSVFAEAAESEALLPHIVSCLDASRISCPASVRERAGWLAERYRSRAELQERQLAMVLGALATAGIRAMPFKGPDMARRLLGDVAQRVSADIDVLVDENNLEAASKVLQGLGWGAPRDPVDARGRPRLHLELERDSGWSAIELHWRVHWHDERFAADALRRAVGRGIGIEALPEDELALLLLTYARDGAQRLRSLADLGGWFRCHPQLARHGTARIATAYPQLERVLQTSEAIVLRQLGLGGQYRNTGTTSRFAQHMALSPRASTAEQRRAEATLVDLALARRGDRRRIARLELFPSRRVVAFWSGKSAGYRHVALHSVRVVGRMSLALPRTATARIQLWRAASATSS